MLDLIFPAFLVAAGLVLVSVVTSALALRFGAPLLLVFLGIGLLAGEDGLGLRGAVSILLGIIPLAGGWPTASCSSKSPTSSC